MTRGDVVQSLGGPRNLDRLGADAGLFHDFEIRAPARPAVYHHFDDPVMTPDRESIPHRRVLRLSKRTVDLARSGSNRYTIWDTDLKGFGLVTHPSGIKSYIVRYRVGGGRSGTLKQIVLGRHGALTPDQARTLARKALAAVAHGQDPAGVRVQTRGAITLNDLAGAFMREQVDAKRKTTTAGHYRSLLGTYILPAHGSKRAEAITRAEIARLHLAMAETPYQANRMLALLGSLYSFAEKRGLVLEGINPARRVERYNESRRERFLSPDELQRVGDALARAEAGRTLTPGGSVDRISPYAAAALRLLLFTGCRLSEILGLRWEHVDFGRGLLFLPDSKTGRKTIVLNAAAAAILADLPRMPGNPHVVCGQKPGSAMTDLKRPWRIICGLAGLTGVRLHDLRHTFASYGAGSSLGLPIIGKLLGHSQPSTTARYAHLDADPLRRASDLIGQQITAAMRPVKRTSELSSIKDAEQ
jgi:integrase